MAKHEAISLVEFQERFATEEKCHEHLFRMKWPDGFKCPKCGHTQAYKITTRRLPLYECTNCKHQTSATVGTIFEKTRTPLRKWFWAIYLTAHDKRGVSAAFLARELAVSYQTAWTMLHKIRKAMGDRDASYTLAGIVELDDAYFGAPTEGGKRGRWTEQTQVLVALSLNRKGHPQYVKMQVIPNMKGSTVVEFAQRNIEPESIISSDNYSSYQVLAKREYRHVAKEFNPKKNPDHLQWLHTIVSNAKAFIGGTYHGLDRKHIQSYLNEFCYRFNRRRFTGELFNRLLSACISSTTITYPELVG